VGDKITGQFVAGDVSSLAALFDRWSSTVHAVVSRALPPTARPHEIDEAVEDVFWQLWQQAARDVPAMRALISEAVDRSRARR
jgi:hypothetical protein